MLELLHKLIYDTNARQSLFGEFWSESFNSISNGNSGLLDIVFGIGYRKRLDSATRSEWEFASWSRCDFSNFLNVSARSARAFS